MIQSSTPTMGKPFTTDPEYFEFLAAPRRAIIFDWGIRRYRWVVMQPLATRKDKPVAVDPDAAIADDPWVDPRPKAVETQAAYAQKVIAYLRRNGAKPAKEISPAIEEGYSQTCAHLAKHEGVFYRKVGFAGRTIIWGLMMDHKEPTP